MTISADPPLDGLKICVGITITFTCQAPDVAKGSNVQYQWSIGDGEPKIGDNTFPVLVSSLSTIKVTCEVIVREVIVRGVSTQYGRDTVTIKPLGKH